MRSVVLSSPARACLWSAFGALLFVIGVATPSHGEVTNNLATGATLKLQITALDPIGIATDAPVAATVSRTAGGVLTALGFPGNSTAMPVFQVSGVVVPVTDPTAFPIAGVQGTVANSAASFQRSPATAMGKIGGNMPLIGQSKVCLFGPCSAAVQNLTVPIAGVGIPAMGTPPGTAVSAAVNLTIVGAPWTQGTAAVGTITLMGNAGAGTQVTTPMGNISNTVKLVTPVFVSTNIGTSSVVPVFGVLDFTLVSSAPEPGTLAALGAAIVSLLAVGATRRR